MHIPSSPHLSVACILLRFPARQPLPPPALTAHMTCASGPLTQSSCHAHVYATLFPCLIFTWPSYLALSSPSYLHTHTVPYPLILHTYASASYLHSFPTCTLFFAHLRFCLLPEHLLLHVPFYLAHLRFCILPAHLLCMYPLTLHTHTYLTLLPCRLALLFYPIPSYHVPSYLAHSRFCVLPAHLLYIYPPTLHTFG